MHFYISTVLISLTVDSLYLFNMYKYKLTVDETSKDQSKGKTLFEVSKKYDETLNKTNIQIGINASTILNRILLLIILFGSAFVPILNVIISLLIFIQFLHNI